MQDGRHRNEQRHEERCLERREERCRYARHDHVAGKHFAQRRRHELEYAPRERRKGDEHDGDRGERLQDTRAQLEQVRDQRAFRELLLLLFGRRKLLGRAHRLFGGSPLGFVVGVAELDGTTRSFGRG